MPRAMITSTCDLLFLCLGSLRAVNSYKPSNQEEVNDKNLYITFINSVIKKSPMTPADYIGKRLGYNMRLFNLLPLN